MRVWRSVAAAAIALAMVGVMRAQSVDGSGAYKTGVYRDLFAERGHSAAESRAKIEAAFQQLFHGDKQTQTVYFDAGSNANGPLAYVTDWANNDARTEGMSYGMMICVQLNRKHEFDAIWNWAHTYMLITDPKNPSVGYFAWSMNTDGTPRSTGAAPDGEEYFVMSLYFAAHRWGNGKGIYDYKAEADKFLRGMRHHPVLSGTGPFRIHPEDRRSFRRIIRGQARMRRHEKKLQRRLPLRLQRRGSPRRSRPCFRGRAGRLPRRLGRWSTTSTR